MLRNYLITALRISTRRKSFSVVNILGLAVGLACSMLIILWAIDELTFDSMHKNADNIYRLCVDMNFGSPFITAISQPIAGVTLKQDFPEIKEVTCISMMNSVPVKYKDKLFYEKDVGVADNSFFSVFNYPFVLGDPKKALEAPFTIVITKEMADKYFGEENPIGKTLRLYGRDDFTVTGVTENIPGNTHIRFNMLRSMATLYQTDGWAMGNWFNIQYYNYLLLDKTCNYKEFEKKFPAFADKYMGENLKQSGGSIKYFLQPLRSIHLHSRLQAEISPNGSIINVYLFSSIAFVILLIASANYINLTIAGGPLRSKEIGARKTFGANRSMLTIQFMAESILLSLGAAAIALLLVELSLPSFNKLVNKELVFSFVTQPLQFGMFIALALVLGIIAGLYPALYLSSLQPTKMLRGSFVSGRSKAFFRRSFVGFQFTASIALIAACLVIFTQIQFIKKKDLGFNDENVLVIPKVFKSGGLTLKSVKDEVLKTEGVVSASYSSTVPLKESQLTIARPEGFPEDQPQFFTRMEVDEDYIPVMGIQLIEGRNFSKEFTADPENSIIVNETLVKSLEWDKPLGKTIKCALKGEQFFIELNRTIVGVIRDYHVNSMHEKISPTMFGCYPEEYKSLTVRIASGQTKSTMDRLTALWNKLYPEIAFNSFFLDESYQKTMVSDQRLYKIVLAFSIIAVIISCIGLYSMAAFIAENRTKEIGIRKVLGASQFSIIRLFTREFLLVVAAGNIIAWPIAFYFMNKWLNNFAYKVDNGVFWWIFPTAGILAIIIALSAISFRAIKAAQGNPIEALKWE